MLPSHRVAVHPGVILLEEFLRPMGLSQAALAQALNIPLNRVNEIVKGKRGITAETALMLSSFFKNSAEFWMSLQVAHDLTQARKSFKPARAFRRPRRAIA